MSGMERLAQLREAILETAARHGARNVRVFGSVVRGQEQEGSDFDFLVDLDPERSLMDLAGLLVDLEELLGSPVDVGTAAGLRPRYRESILSEAVAL